MLDLDGKENIIFDLGGVLLNIDYDRTAKAFKGLGLKEFDEVYSQKQQSKLFDRFETGDIEPEEFTQELIEVIPGASVEDIEGAWNAMLLDLPAHRLELLSRLSREFRIFLLSNTNQIHEDAFLKIIENTYGSNVLFDHFEVVHLSHRIGLRKPTVECFNFVLEHSDLNPEKTVFIDDSMQHIEGAIKTGISAQFLAKGKDVMELFPDRFR